MAVDPQASRVSTTEPTRNRREPPQFRRVGVRRIEFRTPYLAGVTLGGEELAGFSADQPAASVRLLLPEKSGLVMPSWDGNVFLLPGGERATIRTFTPLRVGGDELTLEVVIHEGGAASAWVQRAGVGDPAAISGPGRGYEIEGAPGIVLAGDETALPAIGQLLELLGADSAVPAFIEIRYPDARLELPGVEWLELSPGAAPGTRLVEALAAVEIAPGTKVWAAGEAAAMQQIRRDLHARGLPRSDTTVRGYWKLRM